MGVYTTTTALETDMPGFSFDTATTALASKCITQAENEVDKFLSKRYDVSGWTTFALTPPLVTTLTEWYAAGLVTLKVSRGSKELKQQAMDLMKLAKDNLVEIATGKANLTDSDGDVIAESSTSSMRVLSNTSDYSSTFNEDGDLDQAVDQDKLDDIRTGRV